MKKTKKSEFFRRNITSRTQPYLYRKRKTKKIKNIHPSQNVLQKNVCSRKYKILLFFKDIVAYAKVIFFFQSKKSPHIFTIICIFEPVEVQIEAESIEGFLYINRRCTGTAIRFQDWKWLVYATFFCFNPKSLIFDS